MSSHYNSHGEGSSRSTRDDSRRRCRWDETRRSRSRSPRRRSSPTNKNTSYVSDKSRSSSRRSPGPDKYRSRGEGTKHVDYSKQPNEWSDEEEVPAPPPPPRISKISIGFSKPAAPIKMSLGASAKPVAIAPKPTVASVFNADDDDDEPEEMPAEAKMRMRNIGRDTPTSAGPNSFGKTKQGFCDSKKVFERNLKNAMEPNEKPVGLKFPQTIYKIKPS